MCFISLEITSNALAQFKFTRSKSPDPIRSNPIEVPKMRRSKSHADLNTRKPAMSAPAIKAGLKRFQTTLDNIPSKRLKVASSVAMKPTKPMNIKTQEKKSAVLSAIKSSSSLLTNVKKPLMKTNSSTVGSSKTLAAAPRSVMNKSAPVIAAATKNIAKPKIPPYDFKARFIDLKEKFDVLKTKSEKQKEQINILEEQSETFESREKELLEKIDIIEKKLIDVTETKEKLENEMECLKATYSKLMVKNNALATDLNIKSEDLIVTKKNLSEITSAHEKQTIEFNEMKAMSGTLKRDFEEATTNLILSQDQLYSINIERKVLHNMVNY